MVWLLRTGGGYRLVYRWDGLCRHRAAIGLSTATDRGRLSSVVASQRICTRGMTWERVALAGRGLLP